METDHEQEEEQEEQDEDEEDGVLNTMKTETKTKIKKGGEEEEEVVVPAVKKAEDFLSHAALRDAEPPALPQGFEEGLSRQVGGWLGCML